MRYDVLKDEDVIAIFNPPYWGKPRDLHVLIGNVSDHTTFWALLQHDWVAKAGSGALASRAQRVIPVGRVKFIPESPHSGMDNVVWIKFTRPSGEPTIFAFRDSQAGARPARALRGSPLAAFSLLPHPGALEGLLGLP
jgi:hypothetical protein